MSTHRKQIVGHVLIHVLTCSHQQVRLALYQALVFLILSGALLSNAAAAAKEGCNAKGKGNSCQEPAALSITPLYVDDFEVSSKGWVPSGTSSVSGDQVLGGYCSSTDGRWTRTYALAPEHRGVRIRATVHLLDRWEGDSAFLHIDDQLAWTTSHHHCPSIFTESCRGVNVVGDEEVADTLGMAIDVFLPHTADSVTLEFSSSITRSSCEASLAVDDVEVSVF